MRAIRQFRMTMAWLMLMVWSLTAPGVAHADFTFGEPVNLGPAINSSFHDAGPTISLDGLSMEFSRHVIWNEDVEYMWATRAASNAPWAASESQGQWDDSLWNLFDVWPCRTTTDGLELYLSPTEERQAGGYGDRDIWVLKRESRDAEWGPAINLGPMVNTEDADWWPVISPDDLELYFCRYSTSNVYPGDQGGSDLWVTRRATRDDPWGEPVNLGPMVNSALGDTRPALSADGLLLFFDSSRSGGYGSRDLYMTRRRTLSDPWEEAVNLGPVVNSPVYEECAFVSADGSALYFDCERPGSYGGHDIWQVSIQPTVDFDGDGFVGLEDLLMLIEHWGQNEPSVDIGPMPWGDGVVDEADVEVLMDYWEQEVDDPTTSVEPVVVQDGGFQIYADQDTPDTFVSYYVSAGELDYYSDADPVQGSYCIYCFGLAQYNYIGFNFWPDKDMTVLAEEGYALEFWVRGDTPGTSFDMRFLDTKTDDPADHPWRRRKSIGQHLAAWDDQWHFVRIPLTQFAESGSWDNNTWYNPQGDFDWAAVDRFEIVAEFGGLESAQFWFDDIRVAE